MSIIEIYVLLTPLIQVLGTICLVLLVCGGIIFAVAWLVKTYWKWVLSIGFAFFILFLLALYLGAI